MKSPTVAVITRTKNRPQLLSRCLIAVSSQDYKHWTHVIVNDAGDPLLVEATVDPFRRAHPAQYRVLHRTESIGMEAASNHGLSNSESELVVLIDDDDTWEPSFLSRSVNHLMALRADGARGVTSQSIRIVERLVGEKVEELSRSVYNPDLRHASLFDMAAKNRFAVNSFLYERAAYEAVGPYREDLPVLGDWEFNLRFLLKFDIATIPEPLSCFHVREANVQGPTGNTVTAGADRHLYYHNKIKNEYLRRDIERGQSGIGTIMNQASAIQDLANRIESSTRALTPINKFLRRVTGW